VDNTLKGILSLVADTDAETRCAALMVLTRLKADDDKVVRAVGEVLGSKNALVRDFAVGYFEQTRPKDGVAYLTPLLDAHEDPLRQRVTSTLAEYGAPAVSAVRKLVKDAPRRRLNAIIDLCARVRSAAALDSLFELMASEDFDTHRAACDALIAAVPQLSARERDDLFARTDRFAAGARGARPILVAAAKLFGALGETKARKRLFAMLDAEQPHVVRTHALHALGHCLRGQSLSAAEVEALFPLLDEEDEAGYLRPAIRLLEDQQLERGYLNRLNKLAESPQPLVKRFAVHKLGGFDSTPVVKTLIGYLTDDSYARRNEATQQLKTMSAARLPLMKELLECDDERKAWTIADILLLHDRGWKKDQLESVWKRLEHALDKREDRLFAAHFHFLNSLDPAALAERIRGRAERLRKAKKFAECARTLALIKDSTNFDEEARYAYAVAQLKSHGHALAAGSRRHDPALDAMKALADSAFPLVERLRKERALEPDDLYYLAFSFAEGLGEVRDAGREILEHLAEKFGRTKVGKMAKNKLQLLGPAA